MEKKIDTIDCFGDICPLPIIKITEKLKKINVGERFMLVSDHSCVVESIKHSFDTNKVQLEFEEVMNGVWEVYITKMGD